MNKKNQKDVQEYMPSAEEVAQELSKATSIDDFYGKDGIFAKLFSRKQVLFLCLRLVKQVCRRIILSRSLNEHRRKQRD